MAEAEAKAPAYSLSGMEKASILLIALGSDTTSSVMQQLTPDEIERLAGEIVRMKRVDKNLSRQVLEEGKKVLGDTVSAGGAEYAQQVLSQVFGEAKAREIISKLSTGSGTGTLRWIRGVAPRQIAQFIKNERPQVMALVIGHLPPEIAAEVVKALPEQVQGEVVLRLTIMQPTDPEVIRYLNQTLLSKMSTSDSAAFTEVGGQDSVVQILSNVDRGTERKIMDYLSSVNEAVATRIKENMFVFEDLLNLDNRAIQAILREVPQEDLRIALKGTDDSVRDIFFRNMSQRASETLKEDLEASGPVRLRDVEAAQSRIVNVARLLDEQGEINLRDNGEEAVV